MSVKEHPIIVNDYDTTTDMGVAILPFIAVLTNPAL